MIVAAVGSQGIGLRPHPWALFSRPVGPERTAVSSIISSCERKPRRRPPPPSRPPRRSRRGGPRQIDLFRAPEADDGPVHGRVAEGPGHRDRPRRRDRSDSRRHYEI